MCFFFAADESEPQLRLIESGRRNPPLDPEHE